MTQCSTSSTPATRRSRLLAKPLGAILLILGAVSGATPASSDESLLNWIIKSVATDEEGGVVEAALGTPQAGSRLVEGQQISTTGGQTMVLTNGRDLVTLQPNTRLEIGDNDSATPDANLELKSGTVHVEAGKRQAGQTFSVEAPYLVATVKGTKFDVSTSDDMSAVSVTEGRVGVTSTASNNGVDVTPGKTARVGARNLQTPDLMDTPEGGVLEATEDGTQTASADSGGDASGGDSSGGGTDGGGDSSGGSDGGSSGGDSGGSDSGGGDSSGGTDGSGSSSSGPTGSLGDAVGDAADAAGGAVTDAADAVGDAVGGDLGGAVSGLGGAVGGAVGGLGGAVGGLLGGRK